MAQTSSKRQQTDRESSRQAAGLARCSGTLAETYSADRKHAWRCATAETEAQLLRRRLRFGGAQSAKRSA
jgi:hypothetical protein